MKAQDHYQAILTHAVADCDEIEQIVHATGIVAVGILSRRELKMLKA